MNFVSNSLPTKPSSLLLQNKLVTCLRGADLLTYVQPTVTVSSSLTLCHQLILPAHVKVSWTHTICLFLCFSSLCSRLIPINTTL